MRWNPIRTTRWLPWLLLFPIAPAGGLFGQQALFRRADSNADGAVNISDPIHTLGFLFLGGTEPLTCADAADANDDGAVNLSDAVYTLDHLFRGSAAPPPPFPDCGVDPTLDGIDCQHHLPCGDQCRDEVAAIAKEPPVLGACSAVVRLDFLSRRILGWQLLCGGYARITEEEARARAQADTGYGDSGQALSAPDPDDAFVFYEPPGDFGGVGVVSARTGLSTFGGSIIWLGTGEITYPDEWRPVEELGAGCQPLPREIPIKAYSLAEGGPLEDAEVEPALDLVWDTALPEGLATWGYLFNVVVLLYPRSVGAFDPTTAEWIVILGAGWLE